MLKIIGIIAVIYVIYSNFPQILDVAERLFKAVDVEFSSPEPK
jgi:hypothetical protein